MCVHVATSVCICLLLLWTDQRHRREQLRTTPTTTTGPSEPHTRFSLLTYIYLSSQARRKKTKMHAAAVKADTR